MAKFLLILLIFELKLPKVVSTFYYFDEIYNGNDRYYCFNNRCTVMQYIGCKVQTFGTSTANYYNPNFMPYGLEFKIVRISQLDNKGNPIPYYTADLNNPQRLFDFQQPILKYTYCTTDPLTTSTTQVPFPTTRATTQTVLEEYFPEITCDPLNAILNHAQAYITNGSMWNNTFGALSVDVSVFTSSGNFLNELKAGMIYLEAGFVGINFTLSEFEWSGYTACTPNTQKAEWVEILFYVGGRDNYTQIDNLAISNMVGYDLGSGTVTLTQIGSQDGNIITTEPTLVVSDKIHRTYFSLRVPRFENFYQYGGLVLQLSPPSDENSGQIVQGSPSCA